MKTLDHCIKKTSIELKIPEEEVKKVVMAYWEDIYYKLINADNSAITVRGVGTFAISRYKLNRHIAKKIKKIRRIKASDITGRSTEEKKQKWIEEETDKLRIALKHRNAIAWQYAKSFGNV